MVPIEIENPDNSTSKVQLRKQRVITARGLEEEDVDKSTVELTSKSPVVYIDDDTSTIELIDSITDDEEDDDAELVIGNIFAPEYTEEEQYVDEEQDIDLGLIDELEPEINEKATEPKCEVKVASGIALLKRLNQLKKYLLTLAWAGTTEEIGVNYLDDKVPKLTVVNGAVQLRPYRVYVNGHLKKWDRRAEIRAVEGDSVEIEFGVSFSIPEGYRAVLEPIEELAEKYALHFPLHEFVVEPITHSTPLCLKLKALDTAYVSASGVLFNMTLQEYSPTTS